MKKIRSFFADESGAETIEYVIVAGLIALLAGAAYTTGLGTIIAGKLEAMIP